MSRRTSTASPDDAAWLAAADALGAKPRESLQDAAKRVMLAPHGNPAWRVADAVLRGDQSTPELRWRAVHKAAKAARAIARRGGGR